MKILYGVQGTGNGHITRARTLATELAKAQIEVTYLFSGRPRATLFDMEVFGDYLWRKGLTFTARAGCVKYGQTFWDSSPIEFLKDVRHLDLSGYDLVISDFEPVTAWAGRIHGVTTVGIGHQYAFAYDIPKTGGDILARQIMRYFAPVDIGLGMHWHCFDQPILPPMIEPPAPSASTMEDKILVYLPFEETSAVADLLSLFGSYQFQVYTPGATQVSRLTPNITVNPLARHEFRKDMIDCAGILCNAGFELASEALMAGKKLLVKPLHAQMEQLSNALALRQLNYGHTMHAMNPDAMAAWLADKRRLRIAFPNVAEAIAAWLVRGKWAIDRDWVGNLREKTEIASTGS